MEFYDLEFLSTMGNMIGTTINVDLTTSTQSRGKFARLCAQVDLEKPLLAQYRLKNHPMKIEYEGIHLICFHCGKYRHEKDACLYTVRSPVANPQTQNVFVQDKDQGKNNNNS